jgi:hypothetical protein
MEENKTLGPDYGTNNNAAFTELCTNGEKHTWLWSLKIQRCYNLYICEVCNAVHRIDSSD